MKSFLAAAVLALSAVSAHAGSDLSALDAKALLAEAASAAKGAVSAPDAAKASVTGSFVYTFNIAIASSIPTGTPIECGTIVIHGGLAGATYLEGADAVATRSGATATCTMKIPYLWSLANSAGVVIPQITVVAGKRQLSHQLPPFSLPATGKTTTVTQALRL